MVSFGQIKQKLKQFLHNQPLKHGRIISVLDSFVPPVPSYLLMKLTT